MDLLKNALESSKANICCCEILVKEIHDCMKRCSGFRTPEQIAEAYHPMLQRAYDRMKQEEERYQAAEQMILSIEDPTEREIMQRYYLDGMTWEQVADTMNYSLSQVYRIRKRMIQKFDTILIQKFFD